MNLKSLYKFGLHLRGSFVDNNAFFIIPRNPTLPPPPAVPTNKRVSPSAETVTVGDYKLCYILDKTTDVNGNVAVFYNEGNPIPIFPGAIGTDAPQNGGITLYFGGASETNWPVWVTSSDGNTAYNNAVVNINYNGSQNPPTGNADVDTLVNVNVTMSSPAYVIFPAFNYTIKAKKAQQTNISITTPFSTSKVYDGTPFDFLPYVSTNSNAPLTITYSGAAGTNYPPSSTPPTNAGNYTVTASQPQTQYYGDGVTSLSFSITKITSVEYFKFAAQQAYYTGSNISLACVTKPRGLNYSVLYNGSTTLPVNIGSYAVTAQISDPNVTPTAPNNIITGTFSVVKSNQIPSSAANSTTLVRATYSSAIGKFLVDFVGTYQ